MFALDFVERIPRREFAGAIESHDASLWVQNGHKRPDSIENCRDHIAFLLEGTLGVLQIRDVKGYAVYEPGRAIDVAHHAGIAVEPDNSAVTRHDAVGRAKRLAREKHAGSFNAPALFVVRMNAVVPANRIFEPLFARVAKRRFDLRTDVCLTDTAIEVSHEDDRRNLLEERAILRLQIR